MSQCQGNCTPEFSQLVMGKSPLNGVNIVPAYKQLVGQYDALTHGGKGNAGYSNLVSAYGAGAQCCQTPFINAGCMNQKRADESWGYAK